MDFLRQVCSAVQLGTGHNVAHMNLPTIQLVEPSATSLAEELENLDCLKPPMPGDNRVPLVDSGNVFVPKGILFNIPWVVPRPDDAPKGQKKPAQKDAVYPSELVNHLLSLLVPDGILMKLNATTLPVSIYSAIRDVGARFWYIKPEVAGLDEDPRAAYAEGQRFECDVCAEEFASENHLDSHRVTHANTTAGTEAEDFPLHPEPDQDSDSSTRAMPAGSSVGEDAAGAGPLTCDVCHKAFRSRFHMKRHRRVHTGERPYACEACAKRFTDSSALTAHRRTHTGEKPYACDVCLARFANRPDMTKHKRRQHADGCSVRCDMCPERFATGAALEQHVMVSHVGERRHECEICGKNFGRVYERNRHMVNVHKVRSLNS